MPSTADLRRDGNHLLAQGSLYLRQHAHNPVDWYPWGDEALARARQEDRPIFLSIGYSACHWCHVMEHETFEHDDVAAYLNEHFVAIKVDREERPDLDAAYMGAVQAMTGSGGWPLSVFLSPSLKPFFGTTYLPGDAFLGLLRQVTEAFTTRRADLEEQAARVASSLAAWESGHAGPPLAAADLQAAAARALAQVDPRWGGVGQHVKFPMVPLWDWLLHDFRKSGDEALSTAIRLTLDHLASGGIRDVVGGGFHRYAVERTWTVPHFEKMLYDNAGLARLFVEASVALREPAWAVVARDTLDFMLRELQDPRGGFFASIDADSPGGEGAFYTWTPAEIAEAVGAADGPLLAELLGVTEGGNFEGRSVPTRRADLPAVARAHGRRAADAAGLVERHRADLQTFRARRPAPVVDRKVVTSWNGLAIATLAEAGAVLGEPRYLAAAEAAARFVWATHVRPDGDLAHVSYDEVAVGLGPLEDFAHLALAMLELHRATGDARWHGHALQLVDGARSRFARPGGGFYETSEHADNPLGRRSEFFDNPTLSGTGAMLRALVRVAGLEGRPDGLDEVDRALQSMSGLAVRAGIEMPGVLDAALLRLGPFPTVVIAGNPGDAATRALVRAFHQLDPRAASLLTVPPDGASPPEIAALPILDGKTALHGRPTAWVCPRGRCLAPTSSPDDLAQLLLDGRAR